MNHLLRNKFLTVFLLCIIVICGFCIRVYNLSTNPPGFFADEASIGYNAFTILQNGKDEYGNSFPLFFRAFGEYKNPIQIYLTVPFIWMFGLSVFSVRFTSVILSLGSIIMIYFLAKELAHKASLKYEEIIGLFSSLLLALSPWHIHLSRAPFEGFMPFLFLTTGGTYFLLKGTSKPKFLIVSAVCFGLSMYSYFPARMFIPLYALGIFTIYAKYLLRHMTFLLISFAVGFFLILPLIGSMFFDSGLSRWNQVSIFANPPKNVSITRHIVVNYVSHFSTEFLYTKGDSGMPGQNITRHSVEGFGQLYLFQLPLIIMGLGGLLHRKFFRPLLVLCIWLLFYPVGSMFTTDLNAQATRSIIGVIPFQILTAIGIVTTYGLLHRRHNILAHAFGMTLIAFLILSFAFYAKALYIKYPLYAADFWGWQYGSEHIVKFFDKRKEHYDQMVMAPAFNAPHIFLRFFAPFTCQKCTIGLPHDTYNTDKSQLFAVTPEYLLTTMPYNFTTKHVIFYPNKTVAFLIIEIVE